MTMFLAYLVTILFALFGALFVGTPFVKTEWPGERIVTSMLIGIGFLLAAYAFSRWAGL